MPLPLPLIVGMPLRATADGIHQDRTGFLFLSNRDRFYVNPEKVAGARYDCATQQWTKLTGKALKKANQECRSRSSASTRDLRTLRVDGKSPNDLLGNERYKVWLVGVWRNQAIVSISDEDKGLPAVWIVPEEEIRRIILESPKPDPSGKAQSPQ